MATEVARCGARLKIEDSHVLCHRVRTVLLNVSRDLRLFTFLSTNCYMDCVTKERILIKLHPNMNRAAAQSAASQRNFSITL